MKPELRKWDKVAAAFFLVQGVTTYAWWIWLAFSPRSSGLFFAIRPGDTMYWIILLIDACVYAPFSISACLMTIKGERFAAVGSAILALAATIVDYNLMIRANDGLFTKPISGVLMSLSLSGSIWAAWQLRRT